MMEKAVTVLNRLGLHARPAAEFVRTARGFSSVVTIRKDGETYSAASILEVLTANLDCGATFTIHADGPDAEDAVERLSELLERFRDQEG